MTGPERETLTVLLRLVESVHGDVREVKGAVSAVDERVRKIETASAQQMGVAVGTAAAVASNEARLVSNDERREQRQISIRGWLTLAAALGGTVTAIVLKVLDIITANH